MRWGEAQEPQEVNNIVSGSPWGQQELQAPLHKLQSTKLQVRKEIPWAGELPAKSHRKL